MNHVKCSVLTLRLSSQLTEVVSHLHAYYVLGRVPAHQRSLGMTCVSSMLVLFLHK